MSVSFLDNNQNIRRLSQDSASNTSTRRESSYNLTNLNAADQDSSINIQEVFQSSDSVTVCARNSIADVTFSDSLSFVRTLNLTSSGNNAITQIADLTREYSVERREYLKSRLREGEINSLTNTDWIMIVLLFSAFMISIVRPFTKNFQSILNYIPFRGIKDAEYGEMGGLFHWQTTIQNFISFSVIALFIYLAATFYSDLPDISGIWIWLIILVVINIAFTLRYIICFATGLLSSQREAFRDYITGICHFYHNTSIVFFVLVVLISYTPFVPVNILFTAGFIWVAFMYLLRVLRLAIIFINRNISVFYLILYLCALEILPVAIAIRYFSGTVL